MSSKIKITINNKEIEVKKDSFLLDALRELKIPVPTLCNHKDLTPTGSCRFCLVEVESGGKKKCVTSCNYPVRGEITVYTNSDKIKKHRKLLAEMYLGRYPNVQVIKDIAKICGVTESRFKTEITDENPNACVLCGHCVRACHEFTQEDILDFAGRGINRHMTMPFGEVDRHCIGCTSCAYVCPTGAIEVIDDLNHPNDAELIKNGGMEINAEMATLDKDQCRMREVGTANIVDVMNAYDLLPVRNYRFGSDDETPNIGSATLKAKYITQKVNDACWKGCSMACAKAVDNFLLRTGPYSGDRVLVDGPEYETAAGAANMGCFDSDFLMEYNFYCDTYGVDTISFATTMAFVMESFEAGQITVKHTGGMELNFGAVDESLELLHQMARGEGFGKEVGNGIRWLQNKWIKEYGADKKFLMDIGMQVKGLEVSEYVSKESIAQQAGYAMANKGPQHDEAWLIFMDMVNNELPTDEAKAEALYYFPMWRTWFGLHGLCKLPWNDVVPTSNKDEKNTAKVLGHVRNYFRLFEGMTGKTIDEKGMLAQSERVYNLQRVMNILLGFGERKDDIMPYRGIGPVTAVEYESRKERYDTNLREVIGIDPEGKSTEEKIKIIREYREKAYSNLMDVVYKRKGWTRNGTPTPEHLKKLGIDLPEILKIVEERIAIEK